MTEKLIFQVHGRKPSTAINQKQYNYTLLTYLEIIDRTLQTEKRLGYFTIDIRYKLISI